MTKYICRECKTPCTLVCGDYDDMPLVCPFNQFHIVDWTVYDE